VWGLKAAFGSEYFFSENFSFGGEFGLRMLLVDTNMPQDSPYFVYNYDPGTGTYVFVQGTQRRETNIKFNFSLTYATFTLNYYF
jgi:hypothetical protein